MIDLKKSCETGELTEVAPELRQEVLLWRGPEGQCLLHVTDHAVTLRALLGAGLDPNLTDCLGRSPLMRYRSAAGNQALLDAGADVNLQDPRGETALAYQAGALDSYIGYCAPCFEALDVLVACGVRLPSRAQAESWRDQARSQVTAAIEANDCRAFEQWLQKVGALAPD